ncbi:hypothetical protein L0337_24470 [candidate division KSB1 bacterium]|nr:hypothetical protein [candidate division KSB1 bacterium]
MRFESLIKKSSPSVIRVFILFLIAINLVPASALRSATAQEIPPILEFPQAGLDDSSTYRGYTTRFFRDTAGNTVQIVLNQNTGRVVNLWADAANESISFTARDTAGRPAEFAWDSPGAEVSSEGLARYVRYTLASKSTVLDIGFFLLGSMRKERDLQYQQRHLLAFGVEPFIENELIELIGHIERLPAPVRARHLTLLGAKDTQTLRARLVPEITLRRQGSKNVVRIQQSTFDGKNNLSLELSVESSQALANVLNDKVSIRSLQRQPIQLAVKVGTDSPALTPLRREEIFNHDFTKFYENARVENAGKVLKMGDAAAKRRALRFLWLDRQVASLELMSYEEKLMAGLPNFATYFGRDMMMSALMMEPIWNSAMLEHVIASVLRKLSPTGEVSHEEALGGQAIRENAADYNRLIAAYLQRQNQKDQAGVLAQAEQVLGNLQAIKENYNMLDDDFQLPVLAARYLTSSDIPAERKRAFLQAAARQDEEASRLMLLLRNLLYATQRSYKYVEHPVAVNLVDFPKRDAQHWFSGSWRDSGPGYANGRFAMDINAIWVPQALEAIEKIFAAFREMNFTAENLESTLPALQGSTLGQYLRDAEALSRAIKIWQEAIKHFEVQLAPQEVQRRLRAKLASLPEIERNYWENVLAQSDAGEQSVEFLALSLDENGQPIPVANTDPATWLFLNDFTNEILKGQTTAETVLRHLRIFVKPYPVGLFVAGVGPLVANDAYASPEVWENFRRDEYHSPRTVWGREVNLLFLGLAKQIISAADSQGHLKDKTLDSYVREWRAILTKTLAAVEASGLKHNELWRYTITDSKLAPARYSTSSDIQLWNLTDLAVQFRLQRLPDF